jgi:agmatine deiminase
MTTTATNNTPTRRSALSSLAALGVLCGTPKQSHSQRLFEATLGNTAAYRIPGEFEPARAVWIGYDAGHKELTISLVKALAPHVRVRVLASSNEDITTVRELLRISNIATANADFFVSPLTKYFLRDVTSIAVGPSRHLGCVSFQWSDYGLAGWCQRRYAGNLRQVKHCTKGSDNSRNDTSQELALLLGADIFETKLFIEGGAVEVNGKGLILANESLLKQRNPGASVPTMEKALLAFPGVRKVIWLSQGLAEDPQGRATITGNYVAWGTGGHTDEFVRFADANTILLAWPDDRESAMHPVARLSRQHMQRNFEILGKASGLNGERLKVIKVPMPKIIERRVVLSANADRAWSQEWTADFFPSSERRREGDVLTQIASASYMNFVIANDLVILPDYLPHGTSRATQERVQRIFESVFKGKKIVFVDAITANWVGGGPHCATLKEPEA